MKSISRVLLMVLSAAFLASCGGGGGSDRENEREEEMTKERAMKYINETEDAIEMADNGEKIKKHSARLAENLKSYANHFPEDSLTPEMLFKAANVYITIDEYEKASRTLERIRKNYGNWNKIPETIFMQGFVYDYHMGKKGKAQEYYEELLEKYPDHVFAKDAEASLRNLGKSDLELIREFEEKRKSEEQENREAS